MTLITLYFFAHQPFRLKPYDQRTGLTAVAPEQLEAYYFEENLNRTIFLKVAERCYFPATTLLLDLVKKYQESDKPFKLAFGLSGTLLEQARRYAPALLDLFKELADTELVEFCAETYYHSLSGLFDAEKRDFRHQVRKHSDLIESLFGRRPQVFRNTEMLYNNSIATAVQEEGYTGIITEGVDWLMQGWRSPDFVYASSTDLPILLRNYRLSDDIGYRFPNKSWNDFPLTADKFAGWLAGNTDPCVLLAMDYEALGEHIGKEAGIFDFLWALPEQVAEYPQLEWSTPSEVIERVPVSGNVYVDDFQTISWADQERDTSAWLRNEMQQFCFEEVKRLESPVLRTNDASYLDTWRKMQTSDHLYYLSDKSLSDGDVHKYFSAYGSLVESFTRLHTALYDLRRRAENYRE